MRRDLKKGKLPNIPEDIESRIKTTVASIIHKPIENRIIGILPTFRSDIKEQLTGIVLTLFKRAKQKNMLQPDDELKTLDDEKFAVLIELLLLDTVYFRDHFLSEQNTLSANSIKRIAKLATYSTYDDFRTLLYDDEYIREELGLDDNVDVQKLFPRGMRVRFAVNNISNPIGALRRVKHHLETTLSDENIREELGLNDDDIDVQELFPRGMRVRFAVHNMLNPIDALRKVKHHLETTLSDENICAKFGIDISHIPKLHINTKKYFAYAYITNPLCGVAKYATGLINPVGYNATLDCVLYKCEFSEEFKNNARKYLNTHNCKGI